MVKWVKIGEISKLIRGKVISKDYVNSHLGDYPVFSSQTANNGEFGRIDTYMFDGEYVTWTTDGAYAGTIFKRCGKFNITNICGLIELKTDKILTDFLYYWLTINTNNYVNRVIDNPKLMSNVMATVKVPLISISEQQRIVDILDKFEGMVENVEKELLLRQKQYEFYREKMMNCLRCDSVKWVKIGDEGSFYSGLSGKNKNDFVNGNAKFVTYMNVYTNVALNFDIEDKVQIKDTERQNTIEYGDILFTGSSETPDECGMSCVVTQVPEESIYLNSFCFGYRFNSIENILPDYCKHLFRSSMIRSAIAKTANGVIRFNVSKKLFANIEIPVPSLSKQQEIVNKLDKFEELIENLKEEFELRKKQYEYYREKLLTFE